MVPGQVLLFRRYRDDGAVLPLGFFPGDAQFFPPLTRGLGKHQSLRLHFRISSSFLC